MSFLSTFWCPISSQRVSSLYVEFIQSRDSELIALLLQIHGSPESSGSPLRSPFLTLLLLDCEKKNLLCLLFLRGSFIFCKSSPVFSWRAVFLLSPGLCFFLSLSFSLLWVSEAQLCFSALRWWTREGSNSRNAAWLGGLGSLGGSLSPSPSHRLLFLSEIFFAANFLLSLQSV